MLKHIDNLRSDRLLRCLVPLGAATVLVAGCGGGGHARGGSRSERGAPPAVSRRETGFGNFVLYTLQISAADRARVFVLNGVPFDAYQKTPPFGSRGSLQLGLDLCDGPARATFIETDAHSGNIYQESVPATISRSTLDGRPLRCPFRSLSTVQLGALALRLARPGGHTIALLNAIPRGPGAGLFSLLKVPSVSYTEPAGVPPSPVLATISVPERPRQGGIARIPRVALRLSFLYP